MVTSPSPIAHSKPTIWVIVSCHLISTSAQRRCLKSDIAACEFNVTTPFSTWIHITIVVSPLQKMKRDWSTSIAVNPIRVSMSNRKIHQHRPACFMPYKAFLSRNALPLRCGQNCRGGSTNTVSSTELYRYTPLTSKDATGQRRQTAYARIRRRDISEAVGTYVLVQSIPGRCQLPLATN
ncbi:hypothetical protein O181_007550 [Austropuccinia psidii MF-1]|uniref:Uncharacterized protein n=1 Tax=Austropuccinia psidii MF-1 TaxID=1389203 RepID=A0A9Q3BN62_9BASI|nr:hypothetical protein [Austropuccinia psidii MF-1]